MTIRFTCAGCGSLLKIKDELAGTEGKCPKCKTEFVVPEPESESGSAEIEVAKPESTKAPRVKRKEEEPVKSEAAEAQVASTPSATTKSAPADPGTAESPATESTATEPPVTESATAETTTPAPATSETEKAEPAKEDPAKAEVAKSSEKPASKAKPEKPAKAAATTKKKSKADDDFDPADFLMEGGGEVRKPAISSFDDDKQDSDEEDSRFRRSAPKSGSIKTPNAASRADQSENTSSLAKEMMMRAMEESKTHAFDKPSQEQKEGFDFAGMFREVGLKGGGVLLGVVVLCVGLYLTFDYMMGGSLKTPPLAYVSGTVKLDGQPLPNATIFFEPKDFKFEHGKERPRTSVGMTDEKGHYKMIYIDKKQGVAIGKARVWLSCVTDKGQVVPPDHSEGTLQVKDVVAGSQEFNFSMNSVKPQQQ